MKVLTDDLAWDACWSAPPFPKDGRVRLIDFPIEKIITSPNLPRFPPLEVCGRRPRRAPRHHHGAGIRKPSHERKSVFDHFVSESQVRPAARLRDDH